MFSLLFLNMSLCSFGLGVFSLSNFSYSLEMFMTYGDYTELSFIFLFDYISLFFFSFVSIISSVVFLYSKFYMNSNPLHPTMDNSRFFLLLFLFVTSMFFLVFSSSWTMTLVGWDGLGLVSFLLVIFYNNSYSLDSGLLTVFTNRLGDGFFILSFMLFSYNSWMSLDSLTVYSSLFMLVAISTGCFTKSAQIPFSSWLPAAMAAPTPVSSLVHSSTLVTAGVYLFIRFNFLMQSIFYFISLVSLLTMLLAGASALWEKDFKKIVAMSTLSQLGFMIFSISSGYWLISFLHMVFHAIFKSSLFLATGSLMHNMMGNQDSRLFGSMSSMYFSKVFFVTSCISLMGFPFSMGFYSKDLILGGMLSNNSNSFYFLFLMACTLTVSYSLRLMYECFFLFPSTPPVLLFKEKKNFFLPIILTFVINLFLGESFFFFTCPLTFSALECLLGVVIIVSGLILFMCKKSFFIMEHFTNSIGFLSFFFTPILNSAYHTVSYQIDYTWLEIIGGQGVYSSLSFLYQKSLLVFKMSFIFSVIFIFLLSFY